MTRLASGVVGVGGSCPRRSGAGICILVTLSSATRALRKTRFNKGLGRVDKPLEDALAKFSDVGRCLSGADGRLASDARGTRGNAFWEVTSEESADIQSAQLVFVTRAGTLSCPYLDNFEH